MWNWPNHPKFVTNVYINLYYGCSIGLTFPSFVMLVCDAVCIMSDNQ